MEDEFDSDSSSISVEPEESVKMIELSDKSSVFHNIDSTNDQEMK